MADKEIESWLGVDDDGYVELTDDEGTDITCKFLDVIEYKGEKYVLMIAEESNDEIAENDLVIFRFNEAVQTLEPIEDRELLQEVFSIYLARVNCGR